MSFETSNPAARADAGRAREYIAVAANAPESISDSSRFQSFGVAADGQCRVNVNLLLAALRRRGDLQRTARRRLSDAGFDWRKWAEFIANELMVASPGGHVDRQTETEVVDLRFERRRTTRTRIKVIRWPKPCVATILCCGRHRLFDRLEDVPREILAAVEAGVADALARGRRVLFTAEDIGRALGITAAEKLAAEAWQVGCCDLSAEEWAGLMRERKNDQQRARRHQRGVQPREGSVAAMARAAGVKPGTMWMRLRRARLKAERGDAHDVEKVKPRINKKDCEASQSLQRSNTADRSSPDFRPSVRPTLLDRAKSPIPSRARKIFFERVKIREPNLDASPTLIAADASPRDIFGQSAGETMGKWLARLKRRQSPARPVASPTLNAAAMDTALATSLPPSLAEAALKRRDGCLAANASPVLCRDFSRGQRSASAARHDIDSSEQMRQVRGTRQVCRLMPARQVRTTSIMRQVCASLLRQAKPVADPPGQLTIRNIVSGSTIVIDLGRDDQ